MTQSIQSGEAQAWVGAGAGDRSLGSPEGGRASPLVPVVLRCRCHSRQHLSQTRCPPLEPPPWKHIPGTAFQQNLGPPWQVGPLPAPLQSPVSGVGELDTEVQGRLGDSPTQRRWGTEP